MAGTANAKRMQQRRGTSSEWASLDPVLLAGELGIATDTGVVKVGDGEKKWSELEAMNGDGVYVFEGPYDEVQDEGEAVEPEREVYVFEGPNDEAPSGEGITFEPEREVYVFEGPEDEAPAIEKYDDTELRDRLADVEEALPALRDEIAAKGARVVQLHTPEGSTYTIPPAGSETPLAHQFDLPSSYADWKIAGVGLFEIRDASNNRIYASIVQSFTMNSQGSVKVSFIGSSSSEKTAAKISIQATITPR